MNSIASVRKDKTFDIFCDVSTAFLVCETENGWQLSDGQNAKIALSCLVAPMVQDTVLVTSTPQGCFITHILERSGQQDLTIGTFDQQLQIQSSEIMLNATNSINLGAQKDCTITARTGTLSLQANLMNTCVVGTIIQQAQSHISNFGDWFVTVKEIYKIHARRQQITAEAEIKVDADIIHMG